MKRNIFCNVCKNMKRRLSSAFFLAAAILTILFLASCQKESSGFNFILMTLDTQRADFIGAYNASMAASTPNLDSLAKTGIVFENCFCLVPTTLPSHANMFFSEPPHTLKVYNNGQVIPENKDRPSFVQTFKKHGFTTAAFLSLGVLDDHFGLSEGFDLYKDEFPKRRWYLTAGEVNANLLPWLEQNKENKFFLWIHYSDPHEPYYPPPSEKELKISLNMNPVGEFYLDKSRNTVDLNLLTGKNVVLFDVKNDFISDPKRPQATIDRLNIVELQREQNVRIELKEGWVEHQKEDTYRIKKQGRMIIHNPTDARKIELKFRGKIITPLKHKREQYRQEVEYMDKQIGILLAKLKELDLYEKTNFLIIGDHGEGLGEYSIKSIEGNVGPHFGHTHFLYSVYTKIPLIVHRPNSLTSEKRIQTPVTTLDVAPTIMHIMGFENLKHFKGENLLEVRDDSNRSIFQEAHEPLAIKNRFALLQYPWHLISTPGDQKYELFNLEDDSYEKNDIYNQHMRSTLVTQMKQELDSLIRKVLEEKKTTPEIDEKSKKMLKSLGYIK
jgi:membrane-anchored protein YejM (alkaline phosphatase superfamily)